MKNIRVISSPKTEINIIQEKSVYCADDSVYFMPDLPLEMVTIRSIENQIAEQKIRYENLLRGLNYWKAKANG